MPPCLPKLPRLFCLTSRMTNKTSKAGVLNYDQAPYSNVLNYPKAAEAGDLKYPTASEAGVLQGKAFLPCHLNKGKGTNPTLTTLPCHICHLHKPIVPCFPSPCVVCVLVGVCELCDDVM